jgi:hypothetical protein
MTTQGLMLYCLLGFFFIAQLKENSKTNKFLLFFFWPWFAFWVLIGYITRNF